MRIANKKARAARETQLSALEGFANIGETLDDWKHFRLKCPGFSPPQFSEWFNGFAPGAGKFQSDPKVKALLKPPFLFYRDRLRAVWTRDDPEGINLKLLLGFEQEVRDKGVLNYPLMPAVFGNRKKPSIDTFIPGQPIDRDQQTTIGGLPPGRPIVDGVTGTINWEFGCAFQQCVYELMQQRRRAKVCRECGKFFLANKTRHTYCSWACFVVMKRKRSLAYWYRERDKRRAKARRKSHSSCDPPHPATP
jgi:hypothetical protein